ncbi:MAG TPA: carboxypeptidase-like regulatory domain-containing protein, partial [Saprospiraceae bacterium]|nr:carboxypeptidase-like regulatory domain-containing protein [Saprospiraceae bacterium]
MYFFSHFPFICLSKKLRCPNKHSTQNDKIMKPSFFLLFFLCISAFAQAQYQTIKGVIIDKQSEYPLIGASVVVVNSDPLLGAVTDLDGIFRIEHVPIGRHTIRVEYLGYEPIVLPNILVNSAKETEVNIQMEESLIQINEVVVKATNKSKGQVTNQLATVSARSISVEEAGRFSGSYGDPARMAQNYAGVSGASDDRNDIIIRGNSPLGVLWRMEGIDIPNPSHFSALGTTGGPVSMLNINNLSNSDFFTSAWSADYGNALSGVFDIKLRNGNRDKREYLGEIGFNGFELGAEGPFKKGKKASYLANFRYSTLGVFKAIGIDFGLGDAVPEFQDLTFKINIPTNHSGVFTLWGIGGISDIHIAPKSSGDNGEIFAFDATDVTFGSNTGILGASHTYFWDKNTYTKLTIVGSGTQTIGHLDSVSLDSSRTNFFNFKHGQYKYSAHFKFNKKLSAKNTITTGAIYDLIDLDIHDSTLVAPHIFEESKGYSGFSSLIQAYANW